ncbi:general stress protein [Bacillus pumilus]
MEYFTVENSKEAKQTIEQIHSAKDDIFVFAYDPELSDTVTEHTNAKSMIAVDQGILDQIANVIRTRDDEPMANMMLVGADQG